MTAFLRAVKFIFNFCFYEVFRGVFSDFFSPSLEESDAGSRESVITVAPGPLPPPLLSTPHGWHSVPAAPVMAPISWDLLWQRRLSPYELVY